MIHNAPSHITLLSLLLILNSDVAVGFLHNLQILHLQQPQLHYSHSSILSRQQQQFHNDNNKKNAVVLQMASSLDSMTPRDLVSTGMNKFKEGDLEGSISYFDAAERKNNQFSPYLWQRGISYYYLDEFEKGSKQFKLDVSVNPLDVEEIVWDIACLSRKLNSSAQPSSSSSPSKVEFVEKSDMMSLPKGLKDRRKIMGTVYALFRGENGITEEDLAMMGSKGNGNSSDSDEFYSLFYLGLYNEAVMNDAAKAQYYMKAAANSKYATGFGSRDYMSICAKVHCRLRHWT